MALDANAVKFLLWAKNLGLSFERTITLGRQDFVCSPRMLRRAVRDFGLPITPSEIAGCFRRPAFGRLYADEFFRILGASELVSVDHSDFEGATFLHDLNEPFPENMRGRFDLVLDAGTLEHVFDYPRALSHCLDLVRDGGHFVALTPANNFMGHGFYQFSPELFFRVFGGENGFKLRKMVLHELFPLDATFYEVQDPAVTGQRTELISSKPMALAVLAQRINQKPVLAHLPQQSDYLTAWERSSKTVNGPVVPPFSGPFGQIRRALNPFWPEWLKRWKNHLLYRLHHGQPVLRNRKNFRRLSQEEVFRERS